MGLLLIAADLGLTQLIGEIDLFILTLIGLCMLLNGSFGCLMQVPYVSFLGFLLLPLAYLLSPGMLVMGLTAPIVAGQEVFTSRENPLQRRLFRGLPAESKETP